VTGYPLEDAAERVGVEPSYLARPGDLGILIPGERDRFSPGDLRRVGAYLTGLFRLRLDRAVGS
jgi:hypothetical protein